MSERPKKVRLLPLLHLLCMIALAIWWGAYFWQESPSRWLLQRHEPARREALQSRSGFHVPDFGARLHRQSERLMLATRAGIGDLACGLTVLVLVGIGSGVYVRRIDTWLGARASGHAVAFRGQDLGADALDANKDEPGGILR